MFGNTFTMPTVKSRMLLHLCRSVSDYRFRYGEDFTNAAVALIPPGSIKRKGHRGYNKVPLVVLSIQENFGAGNGELKPFACCYNTEIYNKAYAVLNKSTK